MHTFLRETVSYRCNAHNLCMEGRFGSRGSEGGVGVKSLAGGSERGVRGWRVFTLTSDKTQHK